MPTYQYVCTDCGSDLEAVQSFSDPSLTECPSCGGKLRKRFGAVGVVFKGSGFYRNDSREARNGGSERKSEPKVDATASSSDSAGKSEKKSEPAASSASSPSGSSAGSSSGSSSNTSSGSSSATSTAA